MAVPFNAIAQGLESIYQKLQGLVTAIIDGIKGLFLPPENYFTDSVTPIKTLVEDKIPIANDIKSLLTTMFTALSEDDGAVPEFKLSIPQWGYEGTIIDFSFYSQYRTWIHGIITIGAWFAFALRAFKRLPTLLLFPKE